MLNKCVERGAVSVYGGCLFVYNYNMSVCGIEL